MRVFTRQELLNQKVPSNNGFLQVLAALRLAVPKLEGLTREAGFNEKLLLPAVVAIGSAARGDFDCSSDLDVLFCLDDSRITEEEKGLTLEFLWLARERLAHVSALAHASHVKLEFIVALTSEVRSHSLCHDERFLAHALRAGKAGGLLFGTEAALLGFVAGAVPQTDEWIRRYIEKSIISIQSAVLVANSDDHDAQLYSLVFMRPFHAARKLLVKLGVEYEDSNTGLVEACKQHPKLLKLGEELLKLKEYRKRYTEYAQSVTECAVTPLSLPEHPAIGKEPVFLAMSTLNLMQSLMKK